MQSSDTRAGRRRAAGPVRRFPDRAAVLNSRVALKAAAGVAVLAGAATLSVALPDAAQSSAASSANAALASSSSFLAARSDSADTASRSIARTESAALAAPAAKQVLATESFGVAGLKATEKPKPKIPAAAAAGLDSSNAASGTSRSYSSGAYLGAGSAKGLGINASRVYSAVRSAFGITNIGGYRSGPGAMDHGTGHACDVMISSQSQGDAVAAFVIAHWSEFNVKYVIWRQRIYQGSGWKFMSDRGSITANHYDHVHVSVY